MWSEAILFSHLKTQIDALLAKYGEENPPSPAQVYTIKHEVAKGNLHMVQKVFEGPFEVRIPQ
jgi:mannosyl-oligosaccharide glucosidase